MIIQIKEDLHIFTQSLNLSAKEIHHVNVPQAITATLIVFVK